MERSSLSFCFFLNRLWGNTCVYVALTIVLTALLLSACSNNNKENKLSELEDIKLNQYMTDSGITIPESVDMDTIRSIIIELEDNPEHPAPIVGDTLIADLYEDIRNLVVEYEAGKK